MENTPGPGTISGSASFLYDTAGRMTNIIQRDGAGSSIAYYTYVYDVHSRLTSESLNGTTVTYTYDNTDQLTADGTNTFTYDANGNRTSGGYTTGTGNRLTSDGTWTYSYDDEGNITKKVKIGLLQETWTYGYDNANHMIWAEDRLTDGGVLLMRSDYKYDAFGNRIEKAVDADGAGIGGTTVTRFGMDGWNPAKGYAIGLENYDVWADLDGASSLTTRYVRGDRVDELFARIDGGTGGTPYWYLTDHLGSIRDVLDSGGVVKDHLTYDGFGNITGETDATKRGRYAWTGREFDTETGLQENRARYYDARIGRWTSQDPLGFEAGDSNLYRYVYNAPTNATDPSGKDIYYCVAPTGAGGFGHGGLLIGPVGTGIAWKGRVYDEANKTVKEIQNIGPLVPGGIAGKYLYLSVDLDQTIFKDGSWAKFLPGQGGVPIKLDVDVYNNFEDFFKSKEGHRYSYFVKYPTTQAQNDKVLKALTAKWDDAGYRLLWKNCSNLAMDALIDAGAIKGANLLPGPNARGVFLKDTIMGEQFTHYWRNQKDQLAVIAPGSEAFAFFKAKMLDIGDKTIADIKKTLGIIEAAGKDVNAQILQFFNKLKQ